MSVRHLLVVGGQRCGTTWLHDALAGHPQIAMARPARPEPKIFLTDEVAARGRAWYEETYFAHATDEPIRGEKSTSYLDVPEAAGRARAVLGDPFVVAQLRDPVARAVSHWAFSTDNGFERRPLTEVLEANLEGPLAWDGADVSVSPVAYLERGRYVEHLRPWATEYGDDLRVQFFEEVVGDPDRIGELYGWLGVADDVRPDGLTSAVNRTGTDAPDLPDELVARLRSYFAESDRALADLLGRDLPWPTA